MKKNYKETILSIDLMLFFILTAIFAVIMISPLIHHADVIKYRLDLVSGLDQETIAQNFDQLANYLWLFHREPLALTDFVMSDGGAIHFAEVKTLVDALQVLWLITGIAGFVGAGKKIKKREIQFVKQTALLMILVPLTIGLVASVNFDQAFVTFHHIFFHNDYWIFNAVTDPVILILPEQFFMHCFFAIVIAVLIFAGILYGWYYYQMSKEKRVL